MSGVYISRQLRLGMVDLQVHTHGENIFAVDREVAKKTLFTPYLKFERFYTQFSHLFSYSYASGYYMYIYDNVIAADLYAAFETGREKELGKKLRETLFEMGGGFKAIEVFRKFRGRDPDITPYLRHLGLTL